MALPPAGVEVAATDTTAIPRATGHPADRLPPNKPNKIGLGRPRSFWKNSGSRTGWAVAGWRARREWQRQKGPAPFPSFPTSWVCPRVHLVRCGWRDTWWSGYEVSWGGRHLEGMPTLTAIGFLAGILVLDLVAFRIGGKKKRSSAISPHCRRMVASALRCWASRLLGNLTNSGAFYGPEFGHVKQSVEIVAWARRRIGATRLGTALHQGSLNRITRAGGELPKCSAARMTFSWLWRAARRQPRRPPRFFLNLGRFPFFHPAVESNYLPFPLFSPAGEASQTTGPFAPVPKIRRPSRLNRTTLHP